MVDEFEDQLSESTIKKGQLHKAASKVCRPFHGGHGKLCIKLLRNVPEEDQEEEGEGYELCAENEKKITRICHVCNKGFSSGKALGGHMRIHGQQYKKRKEDVFQEEEEEEYCYENEQDEHGVIHSDMVEKKKKSCFFKKMKMVVPVCSICGKDFQSMKSLYGHMRSHPRNWKGIHPPAETAKNAIVSGGAAAVIDLKQALKGWSVTAKRGRKVSSTGDQTSSLSEDTEEEQLREAAHELMMLAHGESHDEEFNSNSLSYKVDAHEDRNNRVNLDLTMRKSADFSIGKQQLRIESGNTKSLRSNTSRVMTKNVRGEGKPMLEDQEAAGFGGTENSKDGEESKKLNSGYWENTYNNRANENTRKKRMKLVKLRDLGSAHNAAVDHDNRNPVAAPVAEKYKCSRCDKWFPSHQALGGHKSSHNKFKMVIQDSLDDSSYAAAQVPLTSSSQVTNSAGELSRTGSGSIQRQILDFDLNDVPQTEEENEAAAADHHYGYVSISLL